MVRARAGPATGGNANEIKAPMQSTVVKIAVEVGQEVNEGDLVVVLEAMKMEQPLTAHKSGTVKAIGAAVGETVPAGTMLIEFA
jgi:acetyl-CoA/propionyl-CoA carboxylase biotin carboxyl carrier protein